MGAPSRSVVLAALAAAAAAGGLALLFFAGPAPGPAESGGIASKRAGKPVEDAPPANASSPGSKAVPGSAAEGAAAPAAPGPAVEVRVLQGGVEPVEGCPVMGAERDADGEWLACFDESGPESGKTDGDGRFALRWRSEPPERLLVVFLDPDAEVDRFEGAETVGTLRDRHPILRAGAEPVIVHLRDPEGLVRLRILDEGTGRPLEEGVNPVLDCEQPSSPGEWSAEKESMLALGGGWWKPQPVDRNARNLRLRAPGYRDFPLDPADLAEGRRTLRLVPSGTGVRGVLEVSIQGWSRFEPILRRIDGPSQGWAAAVVGEIEGPGPFLLDGLAPGEWEIEVAVNTGTPGTPDRSFAIRAFPYSGGVLDLGTLRPEPGASLRMRWSPLARDLPEKARLSLSRFGGDAGHGVPAEDGWVRFTGLRPGAEYAIRSDAVPGFRETVRAPAEPGGTADFEAGTNLRFTRCRLSFTENGKKRVGLIHLQEIGGRSLEREFDPTECVLTTALVPGRHEFVAYLVEKGTMEEGTVVVAARHLFASVEVPDAPTFEANLELSAGPVVEGR